MKQKHYGFTMIELLTVVAIIAMLVGLLIPALNMVRNSAKQAKQRAQITTIDSALLAFRNDYGEYPQSDYPQPPGDYCGAQKLAEALLGWDLLGFHPNSAWRADGLDQNGGEWTYDPGKVRNGGVDSLRERKQPYLELGTASAFKIGNASGDGLFNDTTGPLGTLNQDRFVLCDIFGVRRITLSKGNTVIAGSPILYYKANTSSKTIKLTDPIADRIYNAYDNQLLVVLGSLDKGMPHPIKFNGTDYPDFYGTDSGVMPFGIIRDSKVTATKWPVRPDSYILISAGADGLYGTSDDIKNF